MIYTVNYDPTAENIGLLIEAAREIQPELETVIRLAHEGGIKTSIGRHLGPRGVVGEKIFFRHPLSLGPTRRLLTEFLLSYLRQLPQDREQFCPTLHEMTTDAFANAWRDLCRHAGIKILMLSLIRPYEDTHKSTIKWERGMSYLEKLAADWLNPLELEQLKANAQAWTFMGSKPGNRRRLLTRAQILAAHKANGTALGAQTPDLSNGQIKSGTNQGQQNNEDDKP